MNKRGRPEEKGITEEYLETVDRYYDDWIHDSGCTPLDPKFVTIIEGCQDKETVAKQLRDTLKLHLGHMK